MSGWPVVEIERIRDRTDTSVSTIFTVWCFREIDLIKSQKVYYQSPSGHSDANSLFPFQIQLGASHPPHFCNLSKTASVPASFLKG